MTDLELKRLERSLSRSALTAKPFYVRGMVGLTETEQGFFSVNIIPVYNPFTDGESQLETVLKSLKDFHDDYIMTKQNLNSLEKKFNEYKLNQEAKEEELNIKLDDLLKRIQDLELLHLD